MQIRSNIPQVQRSMLAVAKQLPYAMSRTLNGLMYQAQQEVRQELPQHFTVRRKSFLEQSIKVMRTTKQKLQGWIGVPARPNSSIDEALAAQEFGGARPNPNGGKVAEPLAARPTKTAVTPPSKWPGKLKNTFKIKGKAGGELILQRMGRRVHGPVQRGHDPNLKVMYRLVDHVQIRKNWNFVQKVLQVARRDFPSRLAREWAEALRTSR